MDNKLIKAQEEFMFIIYRALSLLSDRIELHEEKIQKLVTSEALKKWIQHCLKGTLGLVRSFHPAIPSEYPYAKCDEAALLRIFSDPPHCRILSASGELSSYIGGILNLNPKSGVIKEMCNRKEMMVIKNCKKDEHIYSINNEPIKYQQIPQTVAVIPARFFKSDLGILYLHSSKSDWFEDYNKPLWEILGDKYGYLLRRIPPVFYNSIM